MTECRLCHHMIPSNAYREHIKACRSRNGNTGQRGNSFANGPMGPSIKSWEMSEFPQITMWRLM